jgi:excisionase family DNA binding protein
MAILDFIGRQFIDVIEWVDDSRDTLSYRFPDDDKQIKDQAQLIVRESQVAQFVYVGQFADTLQPGKHTLKTENIPILGDLLGWKYGFQTPFKADVYYVTTRVFTGNKWGTANPVMMRDADFGVVRVRAFGTFDFKIVDPVKFLKEVAGTDHQFRLDEFADVMRSRIVSVFSETLALAKVPALDVATRYSELGTALLAPLNAAMGEKYGLELTSFVVENVSVPPELEAAIDKRGAMTAIGNLNDFVKYNMGTALAEGKAGTAGVGAELAAGLAMGQAMLQGGGMGAAAPAQSGFVPAAAAAPTAPAAAPGGELLTPEQVAQVLAVAPADVLMELEAGNLKGRKIGSQWRISRAALDAFLQP